MGNGENVHSNAKELVQSGWNNNISSGKYVTIAITWLNVAIVNDMTD